MKRPVLFLVAVFAVFALPLLGQDEAADDKSFLENWLETNLSAAGRQVTVTGFEGALSSRARMAQLTVADDDGVWLTLTGATLDWTRSALLTGRLEIAALNAETIEISRRPVAVSDGPAATASDFALPDLPVSITIGEISAERLELGAPVLGVAAQLRLEGGGWLEGGEGEARLALDRIDGAEGRFAVAVAYSNASRVLGLDLELSEGQDGIVATLTGLPGGAPLDLALAGTGPIDSFSANLDLATDGVSRLTGELELAPGDMPALGAAPDGEAAVAFRAALTGDPGAFLAPDYRAFFGSGSRLRLEGQRASDGRVQIDDFTIATDALRLAGTALIGANGWPERARLSGAITPDQGKTVVMPIGGAQTRVTGADLNFDYDEQQNDGWRGRLVISGFDRPELDIAAVTLVGTGRLDPGASGTVPGISGRLDLRISGIGAPDGTAAAALGQHLEGRLDFDRREGAPLALSNIAVEGADYRFGGTVTLDTDIERLDLIAGGTVVLAAEDLGRFSAVAGQQLLGAAKLTITGTMAVPGGPFDLQVDGTGRDLGAGRPELDRLFAGDSALSFTAKRDEKGTRIERASLAAKGATAEASGLLAPTGSRIDARLDLPDATLVAEGLSGPATLAATAREAGGVWDIAIDASAPGGASARFEGAAELGPNGLGRVSGAGQASIADLAAYSVLAGRGLSGRAELNATGTYDGASAAFDLTGSGHGAGLSFGLGAADALFAGDSRTAFGLRRAADGTLWVDTFDLATANLTLTATGSRADGVARISAEGRLRDLAVFVPGLPGAVSASGKASLGEGGWQVVGTGTGPGGTSLGASGVVAASGERADLDISGRAPLALADAFVAPRQLAGMAAFDLRLAGPFAVASLSGQVRAEGGRLALPTLGLALDPVSGSVDIGGGRARLDLVARVSSGGRITVTGPVEMTAPFSGELAIGLADLRLTDPALYDLTSDGRLTITGPLGGGARIAGAVSLSDVDVQIPETGFGVDGTLEELRHVADPAAVRATRARAGLTGPRAGSGGARAIPYGLDVTVRAPRAVFVRGRGLDAELGGQLVLGGTTAEVLGRGGFELIRGRLDLLDNRLTLTEGRVTLRGSLDPAVLLVAETRAGDVDVKITVEGLASEPRVTFSASPALPEDEILARLVFGRGLDRISPFQALKLAAAVATLSGKGGAGTIGKLRDGFGLADLDVTTDEEGGLAARAGAYISDKVYTDVTVGADGRAEINLNLTINRSLTARGSVSSDGNTGIGIYFEKDY